MSPSLRGPLRIEDGKYLWHGNHPFDTDNDCCIEAVAKLMGYSWEEWQRERDVHE